MDEQQIENIVENVLKRGQFHPSTIPYHTHDNINSPFISSVSTAMSKITAGTGISISPTTGLGNVTITNAGVTSLSSGTGISLNSGTGAVVVNLVVSASNTLHGNAPTARNTANNSYTKMKEIQLTEAGGIRVSFDLATSNSTYTAYGQIFKNAVAFGTARSTNTQYGSYTTYSEDYTGLVVGDKIQVYILATSPASAWCRNFTVSYDIINDATVNLD